MMNYSVLMEFPLTGERLLFTCAAEEAGIAGIYMLGQMQTLDPDCVVLQVQEAKNTNSILAALTVGAPPTSMAMN